MINIRPCTQKDALTGNKYSPKIIWKRYNPSMATKTKKTEAIPEPIFEEKLDRMIEPTNVEEDTITFKRSHFYSVLVLLAFAVGILTGVAWERYNTTQAVA